MTSSVGGTVRGGKECLQQHTPGLERAGGGLLWSLLRVHMTKQDVSHEGLCFLQPVVYSVDLHGAQPRSL